MTLTALEQMKGMKGNWLACLFELVLCATFDGTVNCNINLRGRKKNAFKKHFTNLKTSLAESQTKEESETKK